MEPGYPRDIAMWRGVPYNVDAVFQTEDKKTYFLKDKNVWEFNGEMEVTHPNPMNIGEHLFHCPQNIRSIREKSGIENSSIQTTSSQIQHKISILISFFLNCLICLHSHFLSWP